jgi:hypothetical protein
MSVQNNENIVNVFMQITLSLQLPLNSWESLSLQLPVTIGRFD